MGSWSGNKCEDVKRFCMVLGWIWKPLEILGDLGRLGQALECLNCVLDASGGRLGEFWRRPEANLKHLGGFLERLAGVLGPSWSVLGGLGGVLEPSCEVFWTSCRGLFMTP